jgi:hypothetical protein
MKSFFLLLASVFMPFLAYAHFELPDPVYITPDGTNQVMLNQGAGRYFLDTVAIQTPSLNQPQNQMVEQPFDKAAFGVGYGLDYGGIGANLTVYLFKVFGIFAGGGYLKENLGYNAGVKIRFIASPKPYRATFFLMGMYGTHVYVEAPNKYHSTDKKLINGNTFGVGIDIHRKRNRGQYLSLAILLPIPKDNVGSIKNPVLFSIGYKFGGGKPVLSNRQDDLNSSPLMDSYYY